MSRRFQFSLKTMLVATAIVGVGLASVLTRLRAIESIEALDGICWYDLGHGYPCNLEPTAGRWRRCFVGIRYPVVEVEVLPTSKTYKERRERLRRDGGSMRVGGARNVGRDFADDDLAACLQFPKLKRLDIAFSNVSDAGIESLAKMRSLAWLDLTGTRVTLAGIERLKARLPQCSISD